MLRLLGAQRSCSPQCPNHPQDPEPPPGPRTTPRTPSPPRCRAQSQHWWLGPAWAEHPPQMGLVPSHSLCSCILCTDQHIPEPKHSENHQEGRILEQSHGWEHWWHGAFAALLFVLLPAAPRASRRILQGQRLQMRGQKPSSTWS